ncbi:MAG: Rrf2 family transcriptional regulator [Candidatus Omnitrophica bacterium]|nr:Rrf2 family transcriptional regulator [Candidatus Omnitrophota bacterium]
MKLTTRGRYGLRFLLDLAMNFGHGPILLRDIALRQNISEKYLWQLVPALKNAGLVSTVRGAHGGYMLAKFPKEITLKDIVSTLEGPIVLVDCVDNDAICGRSGECIAQVIWKEVSQSISKIFEEYTLADMVNMANKKLKPLDYTI